MKGGPYRPITVEVDPSNACNLNCKFCMYADHIKRNKDIFPPALFRHFLWDLPLTVKSITFTGGGEPLMNPTFNTLAAAAKNKGLEIGLITNGTLLHKVNHPEWFKFIRISLDAFDAESYKRVKGANLFDRVIQNIIDLVDKKATDVGISYVVCEDNLVGAAEAAHLAEKLGVDYIQFKPAWINGKPFEIPEEFPGHSSIVTPRFVAKSRLPCVVAGLIGILGAEGNVYFCCQYRGDNRYRVGNINDNRFADLWERRDQFGPPIDKCPHCRYMNYAKGVEKYSHPKYKFIRHTNFL